VLLFTQTQNRWKIDDVLGVWPLHGVCGAWGGIAARHLRCQGAGGTGWRGAGVAARRDAGRVLVALAGGLVVYGGLKKAVGSLDAEEEYTAPTSPSTKISATAEREASW